MLGEKFNTDLGTHSDEILTCALSRDSKLLATAGKDKVIKIWDIRSRKQVNKDFKGH